MRLICMRHILYACQESLSKSSAIIRRVVSHFECHQAVSPHAMVFKIECDEMLALMTEY